jgi:hypothetical protein
MNCQPPYSDFGHMGLMDGGGLILTGKRGKRASHCGARECGALRTPPRYFANAFISMHTAYGRGGP